MSAPTLLTRLAQPVQRRPVDLLRPPGWAFEARRFTAPSPLTFTADGLMFGHIALWRSCHLGYPGMCMRPPRSTTGYDYFHLGAAELDSGELLAVGKYTVGIGHAPLTASVWAAINHYDDATLAAAVCRAHEDNWGIQLCGARTPDCSDQRWAMARRSPGSGDWRRIGGALEMIASLGVNTPGFPVPRPRQADDARGVAAVIAAGALPSWPDWITLAVADALASGIRGDMREILARLVKGLW